MSDGPSVDTVFGKQGSLYIAFDPQAQGSAHLRVHLYSGNVPRPGNIMGLGSVSLVAAVQAGAVSVHLLDRFGQVCLKHFLLASSSLSAELIVIVFCRMLATSNLQCSLTLLLKPLAAQRITFRQRIAQQLMHFQRLKKARLSLWMTLSQSHLPRFRPPERCPAAGLVQQAQTMVKFL